MRMNDIQRRQHTGGDQENEEKDQEPTNPSDLRSQTEVVASALLDGDSQNFD